MSDFIKFAIAWYIALIFELMITLGMSVFLFYIGQVWQPIIILIVGSCLMYGTLCRHPVNR